MHACEKISNEIKTNHSLKETITKLENDIKT
jgi:chromosomal replication initiation ATPase DnaA